MYPLCLLFSFFLFFFSLLGPPRHLHSFPTRRSSDLQGAALVREGFDALRILGLYFLIFPALGMGGTNGCLPVCAGLADRKSTRLNSSHLVISYAVFCLKKKKKIT